MSSVVVKGIKNTYAMQETGVWSLGWKNLPEKGMATHSTILAWRIPWIVEPGELQSVGMQRIGHSWVTNTTLTGDTETIVPKQVSAQTIIFWE